MALTETEPPADISRLRGLTPGEIGVSTDVLYTFTDEEGRGSQWVGTITDRNLDTLGGPDSAMHVRIDRVLFVAQDPRIMTPPTEVGIRKIFPKREDELRTLAPLSTQEASLLCGGDIATFNALQQRKLHNR